MKSTLFVLFVATVILFFSCKKDGGEGTLNAPYITGVATTDISGQVITTIGNPNVKDSIVHPGGVNRLVIYPNPVTFDTAFLSISYHTFESATVKRTVVAAYFAGHESKNDSLFGTGPVMQYMDTVAAGTHSTIYNTSNMLAGYYRVYVIIATPTYTDSLYENLWVKR